MVTINEIERQKVLKNLIVFFSSKANAELIYGKTMEQLYTMKVLENDVE